jgi:hypothetical protein
MRVGYGRLISSHCLGALNGGATFLVDDRFCAAAGGRFSACSGCSSIDSTGVFKAALHLGDIAGRDPTAYPRSRHSAGSRLTATLTISGNMT